MRLPVAAAVLLLLAGCGGDGDRAAQALDTSPVGDDVTVEEARAAGGRQLVRGSLLAREGDVRICTALMESFPPQCAEPSLLVEGLDLAAVAGTTTADGVTWSERQVRIRGEVDGDVLRVGGTG